MSARPAGVGARIPILAIADARGQCSPSADTRGGIFQTFGVAASVRLNPAVDNSFSKPRTPATWRQNQERFAQMRQWFSVGADGADAAAE